jgi:diacylglycerol kinase family enzyme
VFVNPFGGTGLGRKVWKQVRPMFLVANINLHLVGTATPFSALYTPC